MGPRGQRIVAFLFGIFVAVIVVSNFPELIPSRREHGVRDSPEEVTRKFLDVPASEIRLRAVPKRSHQGDHAWSGNPGTVEGYEDAVFEFFREDTARWFVGLVEVAVGQTGTLTAEVVDRPAADGTPRATLARFRWEVEPGKPILVGMGIEGIGDRSWASGGEWVMLPDYARNERRETRWHDLGTSPVRVRLVGTGGRTVDATAAVASRDFTAGLTPSAWGPVSTMDQTLLEAQASLKGLTFGWIPGVAPWFVRPVVAPVGRLTTLGVMSWSPGNNPNRSKLGQDRAEHVLGPVTVTKTGEQIAMTVNEKPTAIDASPYPLWVWRLLFKPASEDGE